MTQAQLDYEKIRKLRDDAWKFERLIGFLIGKDRERFERELSRLRPYHTKNGG